MDTKSVRMSLLLPLLTAVMLSLSLPALGQKAGDTWYVKVNTTKLRSGTDASASVLADLPQGTALKVVENAGTRLKVTAGSQTGYVMKLHVSDAKPASGGGLSGLARSDVQANERQTVASLRGLSPAAKTMAQREGLSENSVKWAEKMEQDAAAISPNDVENFLRAEKIGL